eukprot:6287029-Prymnesium_polylepis.1
MVEAEEVAVHEERTRPRERELQRAGEGEEEGARVEGEVDETDGQRQAGERQVADAHVYLWQSVAISGNQWQSVAISGN